MRGLLGVLLLSCCLALVAGALDDPEARSTAVIKDYVVTAYPDLADQDIRITYKFADKIFAGLKDLSDSATFRVADVYRDFRPVGSVVFPIQIADGGLDRKIFLRAQVAVFKMVVVAKQGIRRGEQVKADLLILEQRDVAMLPKNYFTDLAAVADSEAKTAIYRNAVIFDWMVKPVPVRHRGDEVTIRVIGDNLAVTTRGAILMDGYLGEPVKVRKGDAKNTKNILEGKLVSPDEVEVILK